MEKKLDAQVDRLSRLKEHWIILETIASATKSKDAVDMWIPYSSLRKFVKGNPSKKLEEAIRHNLLIKDANNYRFKNITLYNAVNEALSSILSCLSLSKIYRKYHTQHTKGMKIDGESRI